jgi:small redox-active disulfide protein 2
MKNIKVLGTGCSKCKLTQQVIEDVAKQLGVTIELEKVEEIQKIMAFNVMSTPGVVLDGKVVHTGSVPSRDLVTNWLTA